MYQLSTLVKFNTCYQSIYSLSFQACSNGFFSFSRRYCSYVPNFGVTHDIVAPYWSDIDFRNGIGGFLATVHDSSATDDISTKLFNQTRHFLRKYVNVTDFSPTTVILGTWYKGTPYPSYYYLGRDKVIYSMKPLLTSCCYL